MRGLLNNTTLALESVQFQNQNFFKDLITIYRALKQLPSHEVIGSNLRLELGRTVKRHTGIDAVFSFEPNGGAYVSVPNLDRNHPLLRTIDRHYADHGAGLVSLDKHQGLLRGKVNLKTGHVSGFWSEYTCVIGVSAYYILGPLSPEELAALTLHEVGHLFTYFEFVTRQVTTNQALAELSKKLDGSNSPEEREAVIAHLQGAHGVKLDAKQLAQSPDDVVEMVLIRFWAERAVSELGSNIYDFSSWEYLADQYAARYGAARYVVTALAAMERTEGHISFRSTGEFLFMEAIKVSVMGAAMFAGGTFMILASLLGPLMGEGARMIGRAVARQMLQYPFLLIKMDERGDGRYDSPEARFKRLRNQTVEAMKLAHLPKSEYARLHDDLLAIDAVLATCNDRRQLIDVLKDTLRYPFNGGNPEQRQKELQQQLEALAANDLFVKAQEFRHVKTA